MENLSKKKQKPPHPREGANVFSALTFSWLLGTFLKGFKRDIETEDLYEALKEHRSDQLGDAFEKTHQRIAESILVKELTSWRCKTQ